MPAFLVWPVVRSEDGTLSLSAGKPFSLGVHFSIAGEAARAIAKKQKTYRLQIVANEYEKKEGTDLGDSEPVQLTAGVIDYEVMSPEASLAAGNYRLWAMLTVQAPNVVPNFLEVPSITVV